MTFVAPKPSQCKVEKINKILKIKIDIATIMYVDWDDVFEFLYLVYLFIKKSIIGPSCHSQIGRAHV